MSKLNFEQLKVVDSNADKILCLAGAGTGKTTSMLERIHRIVSEGVSPDSILVLTFTNAAAFEMKNRYRVKHPYGFIPEFRTFHSFCYSVLSTNESVRKELGYVSTPSIATDDIKKKIIREAGTITNIKSSIESLEKKSHLTEKERYDYDILMKATFKLMRKKNSITFDTLCNDICKLFKDDSPLVSIYKEKYKYIFVDEFQDTDPKQYEFIESFKDSKLFVVGDALQAIYAFRGADSSIIKELSEDSSWKTYKLHENYRSTKSICDFANEKSRYARDSYRVKITHVKSYDEPVDIRYNSSYIAYGTVDIDSAKYCLEDLHKRSGSTAIIARTNAEVKYMQQYLETHNIAYSSGKRHVEVSSILKSVGDNEYLIDWLTSHLNSDKYAEFIRLSTLSKSRGEYYTIINFLKDFSNIYSVSERWNQVKVIRRICKEHNRSIQDRCRDILNVIECDYLKLDESKCNDMKSAVEHIYDMFCNIDEESRSDVYVGTIHSVKGLEFDNVYVLGVNGPCFQLKNEENLNLFYVAITRAKDHLVCFMKDDYYE